MYLELEQDLNDDGTIKAEAGGCVDVAAIPADDPDGKCPTRWWNPDEVALLLTAVLVPLLFCCCCWCTIISCCCCNKKVAEKRKAAMKKKPPAASVEMPTPTV